MAAFEKKALSFSEINGGQKFNSGDGVQPNAINAPIEAIGFLQDEVAAIKTKIGTLEDGAKGTLYIYKDAADFMISNYGYFISFDTKYATDEHIDDEPISVDVPMNTDFFEKSCTFIDLVEYDDRETMSGVYVYQYEGTIWLELTEEGVVKVNGEFPDTDEFDQDISFTAPESVHLTL